MAKTVLVADDSRLIRLLARAALSAAGFDVVGEAQDGREAVDKFFQLRPDLVAMDLNMPRVDGLAAMREILAREPGARILALTSPAQKPAAEDAFRSGARASIAKPFQGAELVAAVNGLLESPA